jgi:PPOX class probable F420-dependent enzyme
MSLVVSTQFAQSPCMNLRSFRKDGTPVDTPVWCTPYEGGKLVCYTDDRTFKAKRVLRNPAVELAACDVVGRCSSPWYHARCRVVQDPAERERIFASIRTKYGIHWYLSLWGSLLTNRVKHRLVLEFELLSFASEGIFSPAPELVAQAKAAYPG